MHNMQAMFTLLQLNCSAVPFNAATVSQANQ